MTAPKKYGIINTTKKERGRLNMKKVIFTVEYKGAFIAKSAWVKIADLAKFIATHEVIGIA